MTDDETRKLIQQSIIRTSDEFTDELMHKVELQKNAEKKIKTHFLIACLICVALILFISRFSFVINFLSVQVALSPVTIRVLGSLFVFIVLNRLIVLRRQFLRRENA